MLNVKSAGIGLSLLFGAVMYSLPVSASAASVKADKDILTTLNARYKNTVDDCDGNTAFYCSGVLLSVDSTWKDGDESTNGAVSFSFLRSDMAIDSLYEGGYGYIFKDKDTAIAEGTDYEMYCAYTYDAFTDTHPTSNLGPGCGTQINLNTEDPFFSSCADAGVNSVETFIDYLNKYMPTAAWQPWNSCSFDANDLTESNLFIQTHNSNNGHVSNSYWNEVELKPWTWVQGDKLPIEAFFYLKDSDTSEPNKQGALAERADYETNTGINVPVVEIDFNNIDAPFVAAE